MGIRLRETERSLSLWFAVSGSLCMLTGFLVLLSGFAAVVKHEPLRGLELVLYESKYLGLLLFGMGQLVAAMRLRRDLPMGARWIQQMLTAALALLLVNLLFGRALADYPPDGFDTGFAIFAILVTAYHLANLRRLARAAERPTAPTARAIA